MASAPPATSSRRARRRPLASNQCQHCAALTTSQAWPGSPVSSAGATGRSRPRRRADVPRPAVPARCRPASPRTGGGESARQRPGSAAQIDDPLSAVRSPARPAGEQLGRKPGPVTGRSPCCPAEVHGPHARESRLRSPGRAADSTSACRLSRGDQMSEDLLDELNRALAAVRPADHRHRCRPVVARPRAPSGPSATS